MTRDSFVFYRSFADAIQQLPDAEALVLFRMICSYALDGHEIECEGYARAMFSLIRPQLDANNRKYLNGKKGGRPKTKNVEDHAYQNHEGFYTVEGTLNDDII